MKRTGKSGCAYCMWTHLAAMVLHENLRHVDDGAQGLNALPFPTTHRLVQNLQLQLFPLPHILTLGLRPCTQTHTHTNHTMYTTHRMHCMSLHYYYYYYDWYFRSHNPLCPVYNRLFPSTHYRACDWPRQKPYSNYSNNAS